MICLRVGQGRNRFALRLVLPFMLASMLVIAPGSVAAATAAKTTATTAATAPSPQESVASHAPIPFKTEPSPIESNGGNLIVALLVLLLGACGVLFALRRRFPLQHGQKWGGLGLSLGLGGGSMSRRVRVVEQMRLNPRCTLYVIEHHGREILLGQCGDTLSVIDASPAGPASEEGGNAHA